MTSNSSDDGKTPDFEDERELLTVLRKVEAFKVVFWRTRKAVLSGVPLYNFTNSELKSRGFIGPWAFAVAQYAFGTIPSLASGSGIFILVSALDSAFPKGIARTAMQFLNLAVFVPLSLLLCAWGFTYASVPSEYRLNRKIQKAGRRKYLYLNSAYGFWPQLLVSFGLSHFLPLLDRTNTLDVISGLILVASSCLAGVGMIWLLVELDKVKLGMFVYDYIPEDTYMFRSLPMGSPLRFFLISAYAIPLTLLGVLMLEFLLADFVGRVFSYISGLRP